MKAHIVATEDFRYTAGIRKLAVPAGSYSFTITSTWFGANDPTAERTAIQITLDAAGLTALRDLIDGEVRPESGKKSFGVSVPVDIAAAMTQMCEKQDQFGRDMPHDGPRVTVNPNATSGGAA